LAVVKEVGMLGEIMLLAMLEDKDSFRLEERLLEDEVGNLGQLLQGIGRVGKNEVELLAA
jgi:hypothetical protein